MNNTIDCSHTRESVQSMIQSMDGGCLKFHNLLQLFEGNHLTFTNSVKETEPYLAVEKVARDLERLLATNDVEHIRRNAPRIIAQINNGSKYRNSYESSIPSDKVWENGTSETLMDILKTIGSNQNHLLIIEEISVDKLNVTLKHLIFSEEKRIPLFLPPSNFRGYVSFSAVVSRV